MCVVVMRKIMSVQKAFGVAHSAPARLSHCPLLRAATDYRHWKVESNEQDIWWIGLLISGIRSANLFDNRSRSYADP